MKIHFKLLTLFLLSFVLHSCNVTSTRSNNISDKNEGQAIVSLYFQNHDEGNPEANEKLFSQLFLEDAGFEKFLKNQRFTDEKLGEIRWTELQHWETTVVSGTQSSSEYLFVYEVKRAKHNSIESFYLTKDDSDSIKIQQYKIESDGFLQED